MVLCKQHAILQKRLCIQGCCFLADPRTRYQIPRDNCIFDSVRFYEGLQYREPFPFLIMAEEAYICKPMEKLLEP